MRNRLEQTFERGLFAARWLVAPIYLGLVFCLLMLLVILVRYIWIVAAQLPTANMHDAVVATLSFIDLALVSNLVLIVLYAGYETFVSRLDLDDHADRPPWLGKVDFTGLKLKLFTSIVAITGIELLKAFMDVREDGHVDAAALSWLVGIHLVFLFTTLGSALSHWLEARTEAH